MAKLLAWTPADEAVRHVVLLFGAGLTGGAVEEAFRRAMQAESQTLGYDWANDRARSAQSKEIEAAVTRRAKCGPVSATRRIDVIWAAGRAGFGSARGEMDRETALFAEVLGLGRRLEQRLPDAAHGFHMLSSAGALFEGRTHCGAESPTCPQRPYGEGKLEQETLLGAAPNEARRRIYRPSSIYGFSAGGRFGLIPALIRNALVGKVTRIVGTPHTIRDYVLADDVGGFVAQQILGPVARREQTFLVANGRPSSIFEVIDLIERLVQTPLLLQFDPRPSNARNMSFSPAALPERWRPTPLEVGVRRTLMKIMMGCRTRSGQSASARRRRRSDPL